jgi:bacterioferritin-associated ferredoxin
VGVCNSVFNRTVRGAALLLPNSFQEILNAVIIGCATCKDT